MVESNAGKWQRSCRWWKSNTNDGGKKLSYAISNNLNHYSLRNEDNVFNYHLSETNPDIIQIDAHAFPVYDNQGAIPINAIQNYDCRIPQSWRATNDGYNNYLQKVLGYRGYYSDFPKEGSFIYQITTTRDQVEQMSEPARFIVQPQIQHWMSADATEFKSGGNREPLNEEIQVQAGIAIAHGAESLSWFIFESDSTVSGSYNGACNASPNPYQRINFPVTLPVNPDYFVWFGLLNKYPDTTKRAKNIYGQDKWNYVKNLNKKILHWKPTLDKITWQDGYSVHSETADHSFISDIKSIRRNSSLEYDEDYPFTYYDAANERYWEMGFFNPDDASDKGKYFIMVNRRCVPDEDNQGDFRELRIKFDSTQLAGFTNWKIIELDTNNVVATFNKNTTSYISMGEFQPGEGKLYKLAPVMQEGGTLVADESVIGIQFTCKGMVTNNSKNITIGSGTNISFQTGAGINMTGGNFNCDGSSGTENINLKGYSGQNWNGINLTNTLSSTKIEKTTFENTKSPLVIYNSNFSAQYAQKIIRRNIFKITQDSGTALRINNQFALSIDSNTFDVSTFNNTSGIYFSNNSDPGAAGATPEDYYNVNTTNNTFSGAYFPLMINNLGTAYSSFYMYNNQFVNTGLFGIT